MAKYTVKQGECIDSIAFKHGHFWETVWNHPDNRTIKETRKDPNILLAGDRLTIPEIREKQESGATEATHRFRRRGVPAKLQIRICDDDGPRADEPYVLEVEGHNIEGRTDADGNVKCPIPPDAKEGKLILGEKERKVVYNLSLGKLNPITEIDGVQMRLNNLGFDCGEADGVLGERTCQAIKAFQHEHNLEPTGKLDKVTQQRLQEIHGT